MEVRELRFGNLVYELQGCYDSDNDCFNFNDNDKIETIVNIDVLKRMINQKEYEVFEPIPLTPKILEKCGFKIRNGQMELGSFSFVSGNIFYAIGETFGTCETPLPHIKHLHKFQNLYYFLNDKELEINF